MEITADMMKKMLECGIIKKEDLTDAEMMLLIEEELKSMRVIIPEITEKLERGKIRFVCNIPREYSADGKRHQVTAKTREECEIKFKKTVLRLSKEKINKEITVNEFFTEWFEYRKDAVKGATLTNDRAQFENHIANSDFGQLPMKNISLIECEKFINKLYHKNLQPGSIRRIKSLVSTALDYAVAKDYIINNYMRYVKVNANLCAINEKSSSDVWTDDEVKKLWDESMSQWKNKKKYRHSAVLMVLIFTGCRIGELLALTWGDVDIKNKKIIINKNFTRYRNEDGVFIDDIVAPKTESSHRTILLTEAAIFWLCEIKRRSEYYGIKTGDNDRIIVSKRNKILRQCNVDRRIEVFCQAVGITYKSSHSGRKTYTSMCIDGGADIASVSKDLGHKSISTTQNSYYRCRRNDAERLTIRNKIFCATVRNRLLTDENMSETA